MRTQGLLSSGQRLLLASTTLATMASALVHAQTAAPANGSKIEEVTVTATRVTTRAQRTPVALTVYSSQQLLREGVHSVLQLQLIDPTVNITTSAGSSSVAVRGVASTDRTEIGDPSVPIAVDGFFVNRSYTVGNAFYDVSRVEVLKGPQGTLFGRNSTGGLINIQSAQPTDHFGGYADVTVGNYDTVNSEAALNLPLSSWADLRVSAQELHHDGYRKITIQGGRGDDANSQSGRVQLLLKPVEGLRMLLFYQHDNVDQTGDITLNTPIGVVQHFTSQPNDFPYHTDPYDRISVNRALWQVTYDRLPYGLTLTYSGGYDATHFHHNLEASGPAYPFAYRDFQQSEAPHTFNHEVRISTPQDQRLFGQAGFFHFEEDSSLDSHIDNLDPTPDANALLPFPVPPSVYANQKAIEFLYPHIYSESNGYFAQGGYKVLSNVTLSAGIRYTIDSKLRTGNAFLNLPALAFPLAQGSFSVPGDGSLHENRPTYHLGVDWLVRPDMLLYAKYDTGYKSGGFNSNGSKPPVPYGAEVLKTIEIGTKNTIFDRRFEINVDAFESDYSGYQASQLGAALGNGAGIFNVGNATIKGVEAQLVASLAGIGRFNVNAAYLDTHFGSNITVFDGQATPEPHDVGGHQLPNAAPWVLTFGYEHSFDLNRYGELTGRFDGKYSSHYYFDVFNFPDTRQNAFFTANLSATYRPPHGTWRVEAYVNNLTDAVTYAYAAQNYNSGYNSYEFNPPRTFGGRVHYDF